MSPITDHLPFLLSAVAVGQIAIAMINLRLDRLLHWETELASLSPLLREVFQVHKWFITITLMIFGAITLRFAAEIGTGASEIARWIAGGIGAFWAIRTAIQWFYYDWSHWLGDPVRTAIHWVLTVCYGGCALVYLLAAFT